MLKRTYIQGDLLQEQIVLLADRFPTIMGGGCGFITGSSGISK